MIIGLGFGFALGGREDITARLKISLVIGLILGVIGGLTAGLPGGLASGLMAGMGCLLGFSRVPRSVNRQDQVAEDLDQ